MADMPTPETAGQISRRETSTVALTLGGYIGTLVRTDGLAPRIGVGPNASGRGGTPVQLQPMDPDQLDSLIAILSALRDELKPEPELTALDLANQYQATRCRVRGCTLSLAHGGPHKNPFTAGRPVTFGSEPENVPADCDAFCTKHNHEEMGG